MKITRQDTDEVILGELGGRLAKIRLDRNLAQAQLARQAGVSKRTVERLESGAVAIQLSGFIRVCRVYLTDSRMGDRFAGRLTNSLCEDIWCSA